MSDVDKRVVQMDFDNKKFEKNVKQSTESINNLKKTLNFDGVSNSIDQVSLKIKAFEIMTTTALVNITNQVVNLGIRMVKSLSVDNISAGWAKYGQKTTSVATMMAQNFKVAGKEITDTSEKMSVVTAQLERLSWFSDETSYTFTDMVDNVGKFIAAGQDLDVSVKAMEGIATWAALSGQNASTAARAMYQLSQAMGKGKIQLIDYKSIQNANMDTVEFRQTILEAAVALGQLTKEGDKFVTKTGKKFSQSQFTEELSSGWFTSQVLVEGLSKYSAAVDQIYELANKEGLTASEVIEKYGDTLDIFGLKAFKAAQEARTFADVLNSVKDAVSSKWMTTSEMIFGNKDEAVTLWTDLSNALYEVFAESGNFRNEILKVWKELEGRADLFKKGGPDQGAFWNIFDAITNLKKLIKSAWNTIFPLSQMEDESDQAKEIGNNLKTLTKNFQSFTKKLQMSEATSLRLRKIFEGLFTVLKFGLQVLKAIRYVLDPIFELGKRLITVVLDKMISLLGSVQISGDFLFKISEKINDVLTSIFDLSFDFSGILGSIIKLIRNLLGVVANLFKELFNFIKQSKVFKKAATFIQAFIDNLAEGIKKLQPIFKLLLKIIQKVIKVLLQIPRALNNISKSLTGKGIVKNLATFLDRIVELFDKFEQGLNTDKIQNGSTILSPLEHFFYGIGAFLNGLFTLLKSVLLTAGKALEIVGTIFNELGNLITNAIQGTLEINKGLLIFLAITAPITAIIIAIVNVIKNIGWTIVAIKKPFSIIADSVSGLIDKKAMQMMADAIKTFAEALLLVSVSLLILAGINTKGMIQAVIVFSIVAALFTAITLSLFTIGNSIKQTCKAVGFVEKQATTLRQGIIGILDQVKDNIAAMKQMAGVYSMAELVRAMSNAFLKIAVSFMIVGKLSWEDIGKGATVMLAMIAEVFLLVKAVGKKKVDVKKATPTIIQMLAFSALLKSFANTLKTFKGLTDNERVNVGIAFLAVTGLIVEFWLMFREINKTKIKPASIKSVSALLFGISALLLSFGKTIKTIANIPWDAAGRSVGYVLLFIISLMTMLIFLNKFTNLAKGFKPAPLEKQIFALSVLLLSFGKTIKTIANIPWDAAGRSVGYVLLFIISLMTMLIFLNKFSTVSNKLQIAAISRQLLSLSVLLYSFSFIIGILSLVDYGKAWSSVGNVVVFLAAITGMLIAINKFAANYGNADLSAVTKQINAIGRVLLAFTAVIGILSLVDYGKGWSAVGSVIAFLGAITGMLVVINKVIGSFDSNTATEVANQFKAISLLLLAFAGIIIIMSRIPWTSGLASTGFIIAFLGAITGMLIVLNKIQVGNSNAIVMQLAALALLLLTFGTSMALLASVPWQNILAATLGLSAVLLSVLGLEVGLTAIGKSGMDILKDFLGISGGIVLLSASLIALATGFKIFADIGWDSIGKGAAVVAGSFVLLAATAAILKAANLTSTLLALSASMLLVGVGMIMAATAINILVTTLGTIAETSTTSIQATSDNLNALAQVISTALLAGLQSLFDNINILLPSIFNVVNSVVDEIILLLGEKGPAIVEAVIKLLTDTFAELAKNSESLMNSLFTILDNFLAELDKRIDSLAEKIGSIIIKIINKIADDMDKIVKALIKLLKSLVLSLVNNASALGDIVALLVDFVLDIIEMLLDNVVKIAGTIAKVCLVLIAAAIKIVIASLGSLGRLLTVFVSSLLLLIAQTFIGLTRVLFEVFKLIIKEIIKTIVDVIIYMQDAFAMIGQLIMQLIIRGLISIVQAGLGWLFDIIDSIFGTNIQESLQKASDDIANKARETANSLEGSMDRVRGAMKDMSKDINEVIDYATTEADSALSDGFEQINNAVTKSSEQLGKAFTNGTVKGMQKGEDELYKAGGNSAGSAIDGAKDTSETHSPSRVFYRIGEYFVQGLANGVSDNSYEVVDAMTSMVTNVINTTQDTIENQNGDDLTIKVGMDISGVEAQSKKITDIMTGINRVDTTAYGKNALYASRSSKKSDSEQTVTNTDNSSNVTYNNVFNVTSTDPERSAEEIDKTLNRQAVKARLARGVV